MNKRFTNVGLSLITLACLCVQGRGVLAFDEPAEEASLPTLTIGSKAPPLDVEHWVSDGNGKFKPVTEFEAGKVYVVEFWATWCGPCVSSMPHLAEIQTRFAEDGVQIISISDEELDTVTAFLKRPVRGMAASVEEDDKDTDETGEEEDKGKKKKPAAVTYAKLTSKYCLTTDPDGSVKTDYMEAAGQNGLPTSFIVGKTGQIEWIGHPMSMDDPLSQIVSGEWDREAFFDEFRKEQERELLMAGLSQKMRRGDIEGALKLIADAKTAAEGDEETLATLADLEFRIQLSTAAQKLQGDMTEEGLAELNALAENATAEQKMQISLLKVSLLINGGKLDEAVTVLGAITEAKDTEPETLNQLSWMIYEAAKDSEDFSKPVVEAAIAAAKKAVEGAPDNGMILDTYAHLLHLQGDLDQAIEVQTKAVENLADASEEATADIKAFLKQLKKEKAKAKE